MNHHCLMSFLTLALLLIFTVLWRFKKKKLNKKYWQRTKKDKFIKMARDLFLQGFIIFFFLVKMWQPISCSCSYCLCPLIAALFSCAQKTLTTKANETFLFQGLRTQKSKWLSFAGRRAHKSWIRMVCVAIKSSCLGKNFIVIHSSTTMTWKQQKPAAVG